MALVAAALIAIPSSTALPGLVSVTLEAPIRLGTNVVYQVHGEVALERYVPLVAINVSIFENGRHVASIGSSIDGTYTITLTAPATKGNITLVARVFTGTTLRAESAPRVITIFPPPEPPAGLAGTADTVISTTRLAWGATPESYGDLDAYVVWRRATGGTWEEAHRAPPSRLAWEDAVPGWGSQTEYRVTARNDAGDSIPTATILVTIRSDPSINPSTIDVPYVNVCDLHSNNCETVQPGEYDLLIDDVRFEPFVEGIARSSNGEPIRGAQLTTHVETHWSCDGCETTSAFRSRTVTTGPEGRFLAKISSPIVWDDIDIGECRVVVFDALGFDNIIMTDGEAQYKFCR